MHPLEAYRLAMTRRQLLSQSMLGVGAAALGSLMGRDALGAKVAGAGGGVVGESAVAEAGRRLGLPNLPHYAPKAKRVIYLFQSGGPSTIDLFDYKPALRKIHGTELPESIRKGQRITGMTSKQSSFPCVAPMFDFKRYGQNGTYVSELLPHTASIIDKISLMKTVNTEAINHDPAMTYINTGSQILGRPSLGAWLSYGLGCATDNLPAYVVMVSISRPGSQPLFSRLWGSGFLPSQHQGVQFRAGGDPVLYLTDPAGVDRGTRRRMLDGLAELNEMRHGVVGDPEIAARVSAYEMAFRMQASVPDLVETSDEPDRTFEMYGPESRQKGSYAANCLLARRMAERGVRFIQLFHRGWDQHNTLPVNLRKQCEATDQPSAALIKDLEQRGMLDETLVIWGGEFGRTIYSQGKLSETNHGRDHHGRNFCVWMAGGGIKGGVELGQTDDYCYNIQKDPVHIHQLNSTILHTLGVNHERFTYKYQGLQARLTGVEPAPVVQQILA